MEGLGMKIIIIKKKNKKIRKKGELSGSGREGCSACRLQLCNPLCPVAACVWHVQTVWGLRGSRGGDPGGRTAGSNARASRE